MSNFDNYLWVQEYKAELDLKYPDGTYKLDIIGMQTYAGKKGVIEFEVALKIQCYKDLNLPITEDTSYKEVKEMVDKYFEQKASKIREKHSKNKKNNNSKYF